MRYYFDVLERGAWIGFDRFGIDVIAPDKMRLASLIGPAGRRLRSDYALARLPSIA